MRARLSRATPRRGLYQGLALGGAACLLVLIAASLGSQAGHGAAPAAEIRPLAGPLNVSISVVPLRGDAPVRVAFSALVSGGVPPYTSVWLFGDGANATARNTSHTYTRQGVYSPTLFVNDSAGASVARSVSVTVGATLVATASATPRSGPAPLSVTFSATWTGGLAGPKDSVAWHFGDGGALYHPTSSHVYRNPGVWNATFVVWDSTGTAAIATVPILVTPALSVHASAAPAPGACAASGGIRFALNASAFGGAPPYRFAWAFGDGEGDNGSAAVTHLYSTRGPYVASVTVTDAQDRNVTQAAEVVAAPGTCAPAPAPLWQSPPVLVGAGALALVSVAAIAWTIKRR